MTSEGSLTNMEIATNFFKTNINEHYIASVAQSV
jgi:hypothetical protein